MIELELKSKDHPRSAILASMGRPSAISSFFGKQKQLEHSYINFVIRTLKQDFMLNLSHIGEMKCFTLIVDCFLTVASASVLLLFIVIFLIPSIPHFLQYPLKLCEGPFSYLLYAIDSCLISFHSTMMIVP